jgi:hypothetical protein
MKELDLTRRSFVRQAVAAVGPSEAACKIIGAKPVFFGQIDGATEVTHAHVDAMTRLLRADNPDVVFTQWPVDTHMDHQVASVLTIRAWMGLRTAQLYFFEVNTGSQTEGFLPNTYVDISSVVEQKKAALFAHVSQDGQRVWREHHEVMAQWRGRVRRLATDRALRAAAQHVRELAAQQRGATSPRPGCCSSRTSELAPHRTHGNRRQRLVDLLRHCAPRPPGERDHVIRG